ncbi:MAG: type II toxin-antitoxin system RelE family toxin [Candidatus Aminicenantales bacterium]
MRKKRFKVVFSPAAVRDVESIEAETAIRLVKDIKTYLEVPPAPFGKSRIKKMSGFGPDLFRLRSGDFRAYYRICGEGVVILPVISRK